MALVCHDFSMLWLQHVVAAACRCSSMALLMHVVACACHGFSSGWFVQAGLRVSRLSKTATSSTAVALTPLHDNLALAPVSLLS